ncbi:hypothetical protein [Collimonas pratensis]|uniref:hypothetical protein n=1 Tax=Collimonas pratensis TaxID=279113 RepID=UPI001F0F6F79|nr:hypothetical protein [Collimonas pratensis]
MNQPVTVAHLHQLFYQFFHLLLQTAMPFIDMLGCQLPDFKYIPLLEYDWNANRFILHNRQIIDDIADNPLYP